VTVETLDSPVILRVRPGTKSGTTVRLRERGIVYPQQNHRGDLYIILHDRCTRKMSHKAKQLIDRMEKELS